MMEGVKAAIAKMVAILEVATTEASLSFPHGVRMWHVGGDVVVARRERHLHPYYDNQSLISSCAKMEGRTSGINRRRMCRGR